uniref:60S ribosomal protein L29 n=1 Tax=Bursaphelenchus xylophilus TaxID=6326 RepID=A0A1I7SSP1_BURXY
MPRPNSEKSGYGYCNLPLFQELIVDLYTSYGQVEEPYQSQPEFVRIRRDRKDHRNGIHKPKRQARTSMKGVDPKFLKNLRFAKKGSRKVVNKQKQESKA